MTNKEIVGYMQIALGTLFAFGGPAVFLWWVWTDDWRYALSWVVLVFFGAFAAEALRE
jgi:hypothetical protein